MELAMTFLNGKGYTVEQQEDVISVVKGDEAYTVVLTQVEGEPLFQIYTVLLEVKEIPPERQMEYIRSVNELNRTFPFLKFTYSTTVAGALAALVGGYDYNDIVEMTLYGFFTSYYGTSDQMLHFLGDSLKTLDSLKTKLKNI